MRVDVVAAVAGEVAFDDFLDVVEALAAGAEAEGPGAEEDVIWFAVVDALLVVGLAVP